MSPRVALLAGGVGGAKLAHGLRAALPAGHLSIIANPGDDFELHGLTICPDHDTLLYTLTNLGDRERGWGLAGETWNALDQFGKIGAPTWFRLGDRDLALHIHRTAQLRAGGRLTEVNREIQRTLGLSEAPILMATDDPLRTRLRTESGWMEFQPWFVGAQATPEVVEVAFDGAESARPTVEALDALAAADRIVIAPSNPLISIGPILAIPGIREAITSARTRGALVVGVSPIVGGRALKGPADRMLAAAGLDVSPAGVAKHLTGLMDAILVETSDLTPSLAAAIAPHVRKSVAASIVMTDDATRLAVARAVLALS
ncbi:MAG: 2-phospho-L-lactate transferase [Candidatus Limnocylindrus sp.]